MNNKEVKNVENKQNNSLMRKTKAQLVELIFRKDSIERNLRADIKSKNTLINKYENNINICQTRIEKMKVSYSHLENDYRNMYDDKVSIKCKLNTTINKQIKIIRFLIIMLVFSVIANILMCF